MDVSVVIVTYNSASVIGDCLQAVAEQLPEAEIVVVDNGSLDDTVALARGNPRVSLVTGHGNVGFGEGVNLGAQAASGRILFVLNPDALVVAVDRPQLETISSCRLTGIVGCRVQVRGHSYRYLRFAEWGWRAELYWALIQFFLVPREVSLSRPRLRGRRRRHWVAGAAFLVSRREFLEVGGFDSDFFLYYEDFDLSRAYRARGLPIRTSGAITVTHVGGGSSPRDTSTMVGYSLLGLIQYVAKWEGATVATYAAAYCLRLLRLVETVGGQLELVPLLGPRAKRKQESAVAVRSWLLDAGRNSPVPNTYGLAATAFRAATNGYRDHGAAPCSRSA